MAIARREGFSRLIDKTEKGDVPIATGLDRPGRDAIDVGTTATRLGEIGIRVHRPAPGGVDLASSAGKTTMNLIGAVAQFERDPLIERAQSGLARAGASGKPPGRPAAPSKDRQTEVKEKPQNGGTVSTIARHFKNGRQTIARVRDHAQSHVALRTFAAMNPISKILQRFRHLCRVGPIFYRTAAPCAHRQSAQRAIKKPGLPRARSGHGA